MKNNTNIYDIDGELIRKHDDEHKMTLEEAQEQIKKYKEKIESCDKNDPKIGVYTTYIKNLNTYILNLYSSMKYDQLLNELNTNKEQKTMDEQIKDAMEELKNELDEEEKPITQEDLLVERDGVDTKMDEYVDFEEVK